MSGRNFCQACSFAARGVKSRIAIRHTCGLDDMREEPEEVDYITFLMKAFVKRFYWDKEQNCFVERNKKAPPSGT